MRLEWRKEGGDLPSGRAIDDRQGTLTITNVRVTDSGTYICRAFDGYSFVTERAQLTVGGNDFIETQIFIENVIIYLFLTILNKIIKL